MNPKLLQQAQTANQLLLNKYNLIPAAIRDNPVTCLKLSYQYHNIDVALYYDHFGNVDNMILKLSYSKEVYIGIIHLLKFIKDLNKEPGICHQLLQGGTLEPFYTSLINEILNNNLRTINYHLDPDFQNALQTWHTRHPNTSSSPKLFLKTLRRSKMSKQMIKSLRYDNNISYKTIDKIKNNGYTVVRTANPDQRNSLTVILRRHNL